MVPAKWRYASRMLRLGVALRNLREQLAKSGLSVLQRPGRPERESQGAELVENTAQGPHVNLVVVRTADQKLRTEIRLGAADRPRCCAIADKRLGHAEVAQLDVAVLHEKHVLRLEVAMHDPLAV